MKIAEILLKESSPVNKYSCDFFNLSLNFIRKIKITVNRRFVVSNIILKIEVVYANKVFMRELKILNI